MDPVWNSMKAETNPEPQASAVFRYSANRNKRRGNGRCDVPDSDGAFQGPVASLL